ncbi:MAG: hypothetical protein IEMM0007_0964 [bacterium]|nr:MAG: hypothetical protein IEMM0007_0964 [bacterium]
MTDSSLILVPKYFGAPRKLSRLTIQVKRDNLKPFRVNHITSFLDLTFFIAGLGI